ncbi:MAG: double-strand break repair protein AddB [Beijerinckiaceae bacterium]
MAKPSRDRPRVLSIHPGAPFLPTLVDACLDGALGVPFDREARDFSQAVFYVPTRRAARALAHAFAEKVQPRSSLLPRIVPLGDPADLEDAAILSDDHVGAAADLPPAVPSLKRKLLLARLIEAWRSSEEMRHGAAGGGGPTIGESFADVFGLAGDLARLIDEALIEGADWSRLERLADTVFDEHWSRTRRFLEIAGAAWPGIVRQEGAIDAAERRNILLREEAARLRDRPSGHPVVAAGSTGTVPATAELRAAIARLPQGAVVLPGLDRRMDESAWSRVADDDGAGGGQPGHPQSSLKRLIGRLGVGREDVDELGKPDAAMVARIGAVGIAALPADATDAWTSLRSEGSGRLADAFAGVSVIEAVDEREEAVAIAVALREALEDPERTAALITPDRGLAERVSMELRRWGVVADDSAGTPLDRMPLAALAGLILHAVQEDVAPASVLALLASPCLSWDGDLASARATLELAAFRDGDAPRGLDGLARLLDGMTKNVAHPHASRPVRRLGGEALAEARRLAEWLTEALRPLSDAAGRHATLADLAQLHLAALESLAGDRAFSGADGKALMELFDALVADGGGTTLAFADYAAVFSAETKAIAVPPAEPVQGRIKIWGLLEARLLDADRIVLGGLNEGTWPGLPAQDPFLNRRMRSTLGLALPERRIGQAAHDFAQALGAKDVVIARARSVEGTPMVASRFLRRLDAFLGDDLAKAMRGRAGRYLATARILDEGERTASAERPQPRPDPSLQPLSLSVTDIAALERDPYAIYARDVLGLDVLDVLDAGPDARDRGDIVHAALAAFIEEASRTWPADPLARLLAIGRDKFRPYDGMETVQAFWWPMFEKAAAFFIEDAEARRGEVAAAYAERYGRLALSLPDGSVFTLRGRGDLVERMTDGALVVTDYKTGALPGPDEVRSGLQPQLTLMAAMAQAGALDGIPASDVSRVRYLKVGSDPQAREISIRASDPGLPDLARQHVDRLRATIASLRRRERSFVSRRMPKRVGDVGPYDHLARAREWMSSGE